MYIKRYLSLVLMIAMLCLYCGCGDAEEVVTESPIEGISELMGDYTEMLEGYRARTLDVTVTLSVDMAYSFENRFSITEGGDGYTVTDLGSGAQYTYDASKEVDAYKVAGYLPPNEIAYPESDVYTSRLSGDLALERLLSGSNLFDGYDSECVTLDGECLFTARADDAITSYTYEFNVTVKDGEQTFPASIKYLIEVNK